jgi:hypothetical protein
MGPMGSMAPMRPSPKISSSSIIPPRLPFKPVLQSLRGAVAGTGTGRPLRTPNSLSRNWLFKRQWWLRNRSNKFRRNIDHAMTMMSDRSHSDTSVSVDIVHPAAGQLNFEFKLFDSTDGRAQDKIEDSVASTRGLKAQLRVDGKPVLSASCRRSSPRPPCLRYCWRALPRALKSPQA